MTQVPSKKKKILILSRYDTLGSSSRYRMYQYVPGLQSRGWDVTVQYLLGNEYVEYLFRGDPLPVRQILRSYWKRFVLLLTKNKYDLIWLQQEAFPWVPGWIEKIFLKSRTPIIIDYDDAFFHRYDMHRNVLVRTVLGRKIDSVMGAADAVVTGNEYLADRARKNTESVFVIPTVVDLDRYSPRQREEDHPFTIGWIGSPPTAVYVQNIRNILMEFSGRNNARIVLVGAGDGRFHGSGFEVRPWSESTEVEEIQNFDVGIMPLVDTPWEKGKCGFKLIQYMACGIPVVASPVGANTAIVVSGLNGFLAASNEEWVKYLSLLQNDPSLRHTMGLAGRKIVEEKYSLQAVQPELMRIFSDISGRKDTLRAL